MWGVTLLCVFNYHLERWWDGADFSAADQLFGEQVLGTVAILHKLVNGIKSCKLWWVRSSMYTISSHCCWTVYIVLVHQTVRVLEGTDHVIALL